MTQPLLLEYKPKRLYACLWNIYYGKSCSLNKLKDGCCSYDKYCSQKLVYN